MKRLSSIQLLWSIPIALGLHNLEEALGVRWLATSSTLPETWRQIWGSASEGYWRLDLALVVITLTVFAVASFGDLANPRSRSARFLLIVQIVLLVNAFWHSAATIALRSYAPGVITALLVNVPLSWAVLGRNWHEQWLPHRATVTAGLIVVLLHALPAVLLIARFGHGP